MEFKKFSAGCNNFGTGENATEKQEANVNFDDSKLDIMLSNN